MVQKSCYNSVPACFLDLHICTYDWPLELLTLKQFNNAITYMTLRFNTTRQVVLFHARNEKCDLYSMGDSKVCRAELNGKGGFLEAQRIREEQRWILIKVVLLHQVIKTV